VTGVAGAALARGRVRALVHAWLILDFFGDSRRTGQPSSSLTTTIFGQAFLSLVVAALLFPQTPAGPFVAANLSLSTLLVGIGHLGDDRGASRARADRVLVATSPLPASAVLAARALHASFYVCLLTVGMALPPAILCAFLPGQGIATVPLCLALACLCSGLFVAALALALRGLERWLGSARAQLAGGTLKALLLFGGVVAFALCARRLNDAGPFPIPHGALLLWPPFHAGRIVAGHGLSIVGLLGALAVLALLSLPLAADAEGRRQRDVRASKVLAAFVQHLCGPRARLHAIASFTATMLYRSAAFRGRVLPLFGMPAAMWLLAFLDRDPSTAQRLHALAAQLPGVYLPFLVGFLGVGDEPRARWLFATSPELPAATIRKGIAIALTTHVLVPVHLVLFAAGVPTVGWLRAAATSAFALAFAVAVAQMTLRSWHEVPFSAADAPASDFGRLLVVALALTLLGLATSALPLVPALVLGAGALAAAGWSLVRDGTADPLLRVDESPISAPLPDDARAVTLAVGAGAEHADATGPASNPEPSSSPIGAPPTLRREVRAVVTLYLVVSVLPLSLGWLLAPS